MEFTVTHTDSGLKDLYYDWWKRVHSARNAWATGMLLLCFMVMFMMRSTAWYLVVPAVASACFLGLVQTIRYQAAKSALEAFAAAGRPTLTYQFTEAGPIETSPMGKVELPWGSFSGLAKIGRCWVLYRGPLFNAQFIAFPDYQLPPEALDFMQTQLSARAEKR
jgi:hypothetical protein